MAKDKKEKRKKKVKRKATKRGVGLRANQRQHVIVKIGGLGKSQPVSHMPTIIQTSQPQPFVERHQQPYQQPYHGSTYTPQTPSTLDRNVYHHGLTRQSPSKSTQSRHMFSNMDQLGTAAPGLFPYSESDTDIRAPELKKRGAPKKTQEQKDETKRIKEENKVKLAMLGAREDSIKQRVSSRTRGGGEAVENNFIS